MIKIFFAAAVMILSQSNIYTHKVTGISGNEIDFNNFRGKKILLVNIATNSPRAGQLGELQQLHQQYGNNLVIIGFPSNSFGNESRSNAEIQQYCQTQYGVSFLLTTKASVKGSDMQMLFYWLTNKSENGTFGNEVKGDFQKYLFDAEGNPLGVFAGSLSPLSTQFTNVITGIPN